MEGSSGEQWIQAIDKAALTPLVRNALRTDTVEITDWRYQPMRLDAGRGLGLYRFAGGGRDMSDTIEWALILKVLPPPDTQGYPREWQAYQSGFLDTLPDGIITPRCYGVSEQPEGMLLIWLEEVMDLYETWPLQRYGLAARHLGQFNGAWLTGEPLPTWPWLSRGWLHGFFARVAPAISPLRDVWDHPLVQRCFPSDVADGYLRLWSEHQLFFDALDRLPQTICHLDANRRNLFACAATGGQEHTVAIDWELVGIGAVGQELAPLIPASVFWGQVQLTDVRTLDEMVFNGYLAGLYDAGWQSDPKVARLGYTLTASLRHGLANNGGILSSLLDTSQHNLFERLFPGIPIEELADRSAEVSRYLLTLAAEARDLMDDLS